jgi:thiamine pyrophosphate-dependent acetolactate synthase large subunit-like protein
VTAREIRQRIAPDARVVERAALILRESRRPILVGGLGLLRSDAREEAVTFARDVGALLSTTLLVRGLFQSEHANIGIAGAYSSPVATKLFSEADCIVAVGTSLNSHTTQRGQLFPQARVIQIDARATPPTGNEPYTDCYIQGDAKVTLRALRDSVMSEQRTRAGFTTDAVLERIAGEPIDRTSVELECGRADPRDICRELDALLPATAGVVLDCGHFWSFPIVHMTKWRQPQGYVHGFGAMGGGIPTALGVAVAHSPAPVAVLCGDLGAMMSVHSLATAVRYELPVLVIVMNDAALGAEYHKLRARRADPVIATGPDLDFAAIGESFGCRGATVRGCEELRTAVSEFTAAPNPMVVDVKVSRAVISQQYRRLYFAADD